MSILEADSAEFRQGFNAAPFTFRHALAGNPLFDLHHLESTAERMIEGDHRGKFISFDATTAAAETKFTAMKVMDRLSQTVRDANHAGAWLKLSSLDEVDAEYAQVLQQILAEMEELSGVPIRRDMSWSALTIFLASPGIVTPYHIDHESNFLLQVHGDKDVHLFDADDRLVLTEEEIETFYAANPAAANYREEAETKGRVFRLTPGVAVHQPPLAPHWVKNGEQVSISVSIGFSLRTLEYKARVYQANFCLRRLGLRPTPPGKSRVRDFLKSTTLKAISKPHPKSRRELLFSGIDRLNSVYQLATQRGRKAK